MFTGDYGFFDYKYNISDYNGKDFGGPAQTVYLAASGLLLILVLLLLRRVPRERVRRIVGLTGTPASNGLMDLWAEVFLIDRGERLGRFIGQYRSAFFKAGAMNPYTGVVYSYIPLKGAEDRIYKRI